MKLTPIFDQGICREGAETLLLLITHIFKAIVCFSITLLSLVLPSRGNLRRTTLLRKILETANTIFLAKCDDKQKKSKDKSELLKGPPRLYKLFYLPLTSSALTYFAKNYTLLIYFLLLWAGDYKSILINPSRIEYLYYIL